MAEYIKREDVIEITAETGALETQARVMVLPSADVEEVVHCKDCEYYEHTQYGTFCNNVYGLHEDTDGDDYCSYGERAEDDEIRESR